MGSLAQNLYDDFISKNRYRYLLDGLGNTLVITIFALIIGVVLGVLVALTRVTYQQAEHRSVLLRILNFIGGLYLTVIRGTPMVVQLMLMYFVILQSGTPLQIAILAFGINSGAYVAEVIRSGIQSVDRGQAEAGRSLGLGSRQTMTRIVLPQAFKNVAPAIFNEFISLLKETSVAGYVGIQDLTKGGDIIRSQTYEAFLPLIAVALIYLIMVMILSSLVTKLERRLARSDRG